MLVVAGAGSGKTRVLTHRIAHLVTACGVKPNEILAITFTNKAAGEMKRRLELGLGDVAQRMWVMTFHAACGRILRREAPRLAYTLELHDLRPGRPGPRRQGDRRGGGLGPQALRPARHPRADLEREEPARRPGGVRAAGRLLLRADRRRRLQALPEPPAHLERDGLRRPDHAHRRGAGEPPGRAREVAEGLPLRPRGRVPGHEPRAVPAPAAPRRRARERVRGRRPRPVDLRLPRRRHPQHPRVRARLRRRAGDRARAELPLDERHPPRRQLPDRPQPRAQAEEPLQRARRGRPGPRARGRGRARRGALRRLRDRRA